MYIFQRMVENKKISFKKKTDFHIVVFLNINNSELNSSVTHRFHWNLAMLPAYPIATSLNWHSIAFTATSSHHHLLASLQPHHISWFYFFLASVFLSFLWLTATSSHCHLHTQMQCTLTNTYMPHCNLPNFGWMFANAFQEIFQLCHWSLFDPFSKPWNGFSHCLWKPVIDNSRKVSVLQLLQSFQGRVIPVRGTARTSCHV